MGILGSLLNGMAKSLAEQAWPAYQKACIKDTNTICSYLENEQNFLRKTVWLLALSKKNTYDANDKVKKYYERNKNAYNNQLNNLRKYDRFEREIDMFMKKMGTNV